MALNVLLVRGGGCGGGGGGLSVVMRGGQHLAPVPRM